jgi:hypothetical protein
VLQVVAGDGVLVVERSARTSSSVVLDVLEKLLANSATAASLSSSSTVGRHIGWPGGCTRLYLLNIA